MSIEYVASYFRLNGQVEYNKTLLVIHVLTLSIKLLVILVILVNIIFSCQ